MIGRLNHVAIAVPDLAAASALYRGTLGASVSDAVDQPEHGVTTVFVDLPNTRIELLQPLGEDSPIAGFLAKNPSGGIHHVCYEVDDILAARDAVVASGARVIGTGEPRTGAHGKPVLFLHPKDFCGTLVELEQGPPERHVAVRFRRDLCHRLVGGCSLRPFRSACVARNASSPATIPARQHGPCSSSRLW